MLTSEYLVGKDGYVFKRLKKTCPADSTEDELFTLTVSIKLQMRATYDFTEDSKCDFGLCLGPWSRALRNVAEDKRRAAYAGWYKTTRPISAKQVNDYNQLI